MGESLKPSRWSDSVHVPQQQSQIHPGDMDQQSLQNVVVFSQVRSPHAAGLITVCEGPLDQLTTFPQKSLALRPLQPLPVGIDYVPLLFFPLPVPFSSLLLLGNIRAHTSGLHFFQHWPTVISLVRPATGPLEPCQNLFSEKP